MKIDEMECPECRKLKDGIVALGLEFEKRVSEAVARSAHARLLIDEAYKTGIDDTWRERANKWLWKPNNPKEPNEHKDEK